MEDKTLYIHVGFHKTGTTSIQNWCNVNRAFLYDHNLDYVEPYCVSDNHAAYALCLNPRLVDKCRETSLFLGLNEKNRYAYKTDKPEDIYRILASYIEESRCTKFLISSECFLESIDMTLFASMIRKIGINVKFIFYFRPQTSWINSVYSYVVMDRDLRFSGSINQLPQLFMLDYNYMVNRFIKEFGQDSIVVNNYNSACSSGKPLIYVFLSDLIDVENILTEEMTEINNINNESFNTFEVKCLNLLWKIERFCGLRFKSVENLIFTRKFKNVSNKTRFMIKNKEYLRVSNDKLFIKFPGLDKFGVDE